MKSRLYLRREPQSLKAYSISTLHEFEVWFKNAALQVLENELKLPKAEMKGTLETIGKFETPAGAEIELVQDEFLGLIVETTDLPFLEKVYVRLQELEQQSLN